MNLAPSQAGLILFPTRDLRLVHMNLAADVADWSGINRRIACIASAAIDLLSSHMIRNESGRPPFTKGVIVEGVWVDGQTWLNLGTNLVSTTLRGTSRQE